METQTKSLLTATMTYGLYLGLVLVIYSILLFVLGVVPAGFLKPMLLLLATIVIYIIGITISTKKVRSEIYAGEVSYGQAFVIGLLIASTAAIVSTFYSYIQNTLIDPDYFMRTISAQKEWTINFMQNKGVSEDQIDKAIAKFDEQIKNYSSIKNTLKGFLGSVIFGLIISLITAAFLKKKTNPFENPNV